MKILSYLFESFSWESIRPTIYYEELLNSHKNVLKKGSLENGRVFFVTIEDHDTSSIAIRALEIIVSNSRASDCILIYPYKHLSKDLCKSSTIRKIYKIIQEKSNDRIVFAELGSIKKFKVETNSDPQELYWQIDQEFLKGELETRTCNLDTTTNNFFRITNKNEILLVEANRRVISEKTDKFFNNLNTIVFLKETHQHQKIKPIEEDHRLHQWRIKQIETISKILPYTETGSYFYGPLYLKIRDNLRQIINQIIEEDQKIFKIKSPLWWDTNNLTEQYLKKFPQKQYLLSNKQYFLRFSCCMGSFIFLNGLKLSHKHLPLHIYQEGICFRKEKSGECKKLKRNRLFEMHDCHSFCLEDQKLNLSEFFKKVTKLTLIYKRLEINQNITPQIGLTRDFYDRFKFLFLDLLKEYQILWQIWQSSDFYFKIKLQFNYVFYDQVTQLGTVQLDTLNSTYFEVNYYNSLNNPLKTVILHSSPGSYQRLIYAISARPTLELLPWTIKILTIQSLDQELLQLVKNWSRDLLGSIALDNRKIRINKKIQLAHDGFTGLFIVVGSEEIRAIKEDLKTQEFIYKVTDCTTNQHLRLSFSQIKQYLIDNNIRDLRDVSEIHQFNSSN